MSQLVGPGAGMCGTSGPILGSGSLCLCDSYKRVCLIDYSTPHILDPRCIMKAQGYSFFFHPPRSFLHLRFSAFRRRLPLEESTEACERTVGVLDADGGRCRCMRAPIALVWRRSTSASP